MKPLVAAAPPDRADIARLGMWAFLASELLLFGGLLALYAGARLEHPAAFAEGCAHTSQPLGLAMTLVLLSSSFLVATAERALWAGARRLCLALLALSIVLGGLFVALKLTEYGHHLAEGIGPGGAGAFYAAHRARGLRAFFTLYYLATGLHALHVAAGLSLLGWACVSVLRRRITPERAYPLELCALYWHLVDVIWVFLWPLFYLMHGAP